MPAPTPCSGGCTRRERRAEVSQHVRFSLTGHRRDKPDDSGSAVPLLRQVHVAPERRSRELLHARGLAEVESLRLVKAHLGSRPYSQTVDRKQLSGFARFSSHDFACLLSLRWSGNHQGTTRIDFEGIEGPKWGTRHPFRHPPNRAG
jgi:hypothetical protein